jgi:hypothetical protein
VFDIGEERIGQFPALLELRLLLRFVRRYTYNDRIGAGELIICVAKLARLKRSPGRVSLGIEKQDDVLPPQACEVKHLTGVGLEDDGRRRVARFWHWAHTRQG